MKTLIIAIALYLSLWGGVYLFWAFVALDLGWVLTFGDAQHGWMGRLSLGIMLVLSAPFVLVAAGYVHEAIKVAQGDGQ